MSKSQKINSSKEIGRAYMSPYGTAEKEQLIVSFDESVTDKEWTDLRERMKVFIKKCKEKRGKMAYSDGANGGKLVMHCEFDPQLVEKKGKEPVGDIDASDIEQEVDREEVVESGNKHDTD